jgi:biopolymer transport protein ExbB
MSEIWMHIQNLIERGGILMVPILACSVVTVGILIERLWALRLQSVIGRGRFAPIINHLSQGEFDEAFIIARTLDTPGGRILTAGLSVHQGGPEVMQSAMEETGREEVAALHENVETLGTIASITPLIGLLGTVLGMIDVFQGVVADAGMSGGSVNPASLASGIWTALLTTAAGLSVAIPSFVIYRLLQGRCERYSMLLTTYALRCLRYRYPLMGGSAKDDTMAETEA